MSDKEKIDKALTLIREAGVRDEVTTPEEVYDAMRDCELGDLAEGIADMIMLIYNVRNVLGGDNE